MRKQLLFAAALMCSASLAQAALITTQTGSGTTPTKDGALGTDEYGVGNSQVYTGGGAGFGGTLGAGSIYMENDATNLYVAFDPGNDLNDVVGIWLNTQAGGFADSDMSDSGDGSRVVLSDLTLSVDDVFSSGTTSLPDYGLTIGNFGTVLFELNAGSTANHLNFVAFDGTFTTNNPTLVREVVIPLADIGVTAGDTIEWFAAYGAGGGFASNESIPVQGFNAGNNLGTDNDGTSLPVNHDNFNSFVTLAPAAPVTVTVDAAGVADGTTIFNTIQAAIDSFSSGGTNAGSGSPFTVNVVAASGPYVETMSLNDGNAGNGDIQGDIILQSSVPGTLVDVRLNATNGDDGVLIYQSTENVTITDFIFSPEQGGGVADDLVKIDENTNSAVNTITFNNCIFTDVADAGGPLISTLTGPFSDPTFTGQLAGTDTLMKVWGDNAEYMNVVINDSLFYGAKARGIQYGTIATAGTASDYTLDINNTTFAYTGEAGTRSPIDLQGNGAQPKVMNIDGSTFTGSRHHAIVSAFHDTNAHEVNITNTTFDNTNTFRAFSGDDNTNLNLDGVIIHQGVAQPAIVYGGWDNTTWNNLTLHSAGSNALLTVNAGAANTITVRDSIFSGSGTTFGELATVIIPGIDVDDSAIVQDGIVAVTAVGTPTGLTLGGNVTVLDPAYVDAANGDFDVQNTAYAGAGSAASDLSGGAAYLGGVAPAAVDLSGVAASLSFGSVQSGNSSAAQQINVANTGGATTTITSALSGTDAAEFSALFGATTSVVIAGGGNENIDVVFSPTSTGAKTASLALDGLSATGGPTATALDGTSTANVGDWNMLDN